MIDFEKVSIDVKLEIIYCWLESILLEDELSEENVYLINEISEYLLEERS